MMTPSTWSLLSQSLRLLGRTTVLLYPILLLLLLLGLLKMPADQTRVLATTPEGIALVVVLFFVSCAILAGWAAMVYQACLAWCSLFFVALPSYQPKFDKKALAALKANSSPSSTAQDSVQKAEAAGLLTPLSGMLQLGQAFFSGIGQFFGPVLLGVGLQVFALFGIIALTQWGVHEVGGVPPVVAQIAAYIKQHPTLTQVQLNQYLESTLLAAGVPQLITLRNVCFVLIGGLTAYSTVATLTLFWLPILLVWRRSVWWCYWQSVCQFARDPWRLMALLAWMMVMDGALFALMVISASLNSTLLGMMTEFLWMMSVVYRFLMLMQYTLVVTGGPQLFGHSFDTPSPSAQDASLDTRA
jgi:hypothetical protein